jgi:hypothetical protein
VASLVLRLDLTGGQKEGLTGGQTGGQTGGLKAVLILEI